MKYNTIIKSGHLTKEFKEEYNLLKKIGYDDLNYDAMWKWSSILNVFSTLLKDKKNLRIVDIGGGMSPLHFILSNYHKVTNVEKSFKNNWFPTNSEGKYVRNTNFIINNTNIEYIEADFLKYIGDLPDNSVDVFYDACSLIHFQPSTQLDQKNDGVFYTAKHIKRVLKEGGIYISCSDVLHPLAKKVGEVEFNEGEWLYPENLFNIYKNAGLEPLDVPDFEMEDFFMKPENIFYNVKHAPSHRRQTPDYAVKKHLPDYHCLTHLHKGNLLAICRFVFKKVISDEKNNNMHNN